MSIAREARQIAFEEYEDWKHYTMEQLQLLRDAEVQEAEMNLIHIVEYYKALFELKEKE